MPNSQRLAVVLHPPGLQDPDDTDTWPLAFSSVLGLRPLADVPPKHLGPYPVVSNFVAVLSVLVHCLIILNLPVAFCCLAFMAPILLALAKVLMPRSLAV